jgi:hypothetical protein
MYCICIMYVLSKTFHRDYIRGFVQSRRRKQVHERDKRNSIVPCYRHLKIICRQGGITINFPITKANRFNNLSTQFVIEPIYSTLIIFFHKHY